MRLMVTRPLPAPVIEAARARFDLTLRESDAPMEVGEMVAALAGHDIVMPTLGDRFTAAVLARVPQPRARLLANFGAGTNHIDVAAARARGIEVTNTPGVVTEATADIALTLILATARRAGEGERLLRAGRWTGWAPTQLLGREVAGARVGIVGYGRIGRAVARRCHHGFGMEVVFHNRSAVAEPGVPARQVPLAAAMAADFVVASVPGGPATRHLIGAPALAAMRPHGILVNISRGDVVDEAALVAALDAGRIGGAGLDVYEDEPRIHPGLLAREDVTLLPHLGTATAATREAMGMTALANALALAEGRPLPNPV